MEFSSARHVAATLAAAEPGGLPFYAQQAGEVALFEHAFHQRLPLLIKGPTGCGKTRFVEYMAYRLGKPTWSAGT